MERKFSGFICLVLMKMTSPQIVVGLIKVML